MSLEWAGRYTPGFYDRYVLQVSVGFAVVGVIAAFLFVALLGIPFIGQIVVCSIGGAIGGASLRRGWRAAVRFGLGFGVALGVVLPITIVSLQDSLMPPWIIGGFVVGFGVAGMIGPRISGLGSRMVYAGAAAFGVAGAIGGTVIVIAFFSIDGFVAVGLGILIPHALGLGQA